MLRCFKEFKYTGRFAMTLCGGILIQSMRQGTELELGCRTSPSGYRLAESIPGLFKSLKIPSLDSQRYHLARLDLHQSGTIG
jgi:hypothetical protein